MSDTKCQFREVYETVRTYFFPRRIDVPDHVWQLLARIYPTVDWERVGFYRGWPHVLRRGGFHAITLPDPHSFDRINVYFEPDAWRPDARSGLATIVHEGYHVLQIQQMVGGYGIGLARPFLAAYLAEWAGSGFSYADHPMEEEAYHVAGRPTALFDRHMPAHVHEDPEDAHDLGALVQEASRRTFREHMSESHPGGETTGASAALTNVLSAVWTLIWFVVALLLAAAFLVVDAVGLLVTGVLWVVMQIVCKIHPQVGL